MLANVQQQQNISTDIIFILMLELQHRHIYNFCSISVKKE